MSDSAAPHSALRLYKRLMAYVWPYKWVFLASIFGMAVVSATEGGFAWIMKPLIDGGFVDNDADLVRYIPLIVVAIFLVRGLRASSGVPAGAWKLNQTPNSSSG